MAVHGDGGFAGWRWPDWTDEDAPRANSSPRWPAPKPPAATPPWPAFLTRHGRRSCSPCARFAWLTRAQRWRAFSNTAASARDRRRWIHRAKGEAACGHAAAAEVHPRALCRGVTFSRHALTPDQKAPHQARNETRYRGGTGGRGSGFATAPPGEDGEGDSREVSGPQVDLTGQTLARVGDLGAGKGERGFR